MAQSETAQQLDYMSIATYLPHLEHEQNFRIKILYFTINKLKMTFKILSLF